VSQPITTQLFDGMLRFKWNSHNYSRKKKFSNYLIKPNKIENKNEYLLAPLASHEKNGYDANIYNCTRTYYIGNW